MTQTVYVDTPPTITLAQETTLTTTSGTATYIAEQAPPQTVWVLYEAKGEYSDYSMEIWGVFTSPTLAQVAFDAYLPLNMRGAWRCEGDMLVKCVKQASERVTSLTIQPYTLNQLRAEYQRGGEANLGGSL